MRTSHPRDRLERLRSLLGFIRVRCLACGNRFPHSLWQFGQWRFARCPRCYRVDLGTWSETHYIVRWNVRLLLALGAKRYRCEVCRHNFASFRRLKERYHFHRQGRPSGEAGAEEWLEKENGSK